MANFPLGLVHGTSDFYGCVNAIHVYLLKSQHKLPIRLVIRFCYFVHSQYELYIYILTQRC